MTRDSFLPLGAAVLLVVCGTQGLSQGITQNYPTKAVRVVEPFGAGGALTSSPVP